MAIISDIKIDNKSIKMLPDIVYPLIPVIGKKTGGRKASLTKLRDKYAMNILFGSNDKYEFFFYCVMDLLLLCVGFNSSIPTVKLEKGHYYSMEATSLIRDSTTTSDLTFLVTFEVRDYGNEGCNNGYAVAASITLKTNVSGGVYLLWDYK